MKGLIWVLLISTLTRLYDAKSLIQVPSRSVQDSGRRVVCYYGSWAVYRPDLGKFDVENINPYICTHVIYAFAGLNPSTYEIESLDPYNDLYDNYGKGAFNRFTNLATINPDLKCILGIGGWNEGSLKYSDMANDPAKRSTFVNSIVPFLKTYGFVGLDLDWEYPTQNGGKPSDRDAYVELLKELKAALSAEGFSLSIAAAAGKSTIDAAYNVPEIVKYLDFINLMAYDFHGPWEPFTGHNTPLYSKSSETPDEQLLNVDYAVSYWLQLGAPASMINLGMATYGHSFTLADPAQNGFYAATWGPGTAGPYTRQSGTLGYNEICVNLNAGGWTIQVDPDYKAPYGYNGNQWIGYDDPNSIAEKCKLANAYGLGGGMIWSIETDDFQPTCSSTQFPLLVVINQYIRDMTPNSTFPTLPPPPPTTPYTGPTTTPRTNPTPAPTDICKKEGFVADPNDCTTFYECVANPNGSWSMYEFHCGAGTVFDPAIDSCNYDYNVPDCHADI